MASELTSDAVLAFCRACSWAHEVWSLHRAFQMGLPSNARVARRHVYLFGRLSCITQEYTLLQICKLHDPAVQGRNENLSLSFVVERGPWDPATRTLLDQMRGQLGRLHEQLALARRKLFAHSDLKANIAGDSLGGFQEGMDDEYFATLQEFVDVIHDKFFGGPYRFDSFAPIDVDLLLEDLRGAR